MGAFVRGVALGYGALRWVRNLFAATVLLAVPALADGPVVAALGDSLTAGYGLATADGFVPQLQGWLDDQGVAVELRNAGVSGDTTAGGLARVDWTLTPEVEGLIVALGGNDYLRGFDPALTRANLTGILDTAKAKNVPVMLIGLQVGSNYGPDYKAAFEAVYTDLAAVYDVPLFPGFFAGMRKATDGGPLTPYMQGDGIHPTAEGVALVVAEMGPAVANFVTGLGD